jgi:hypothetical protein
MSVHPIPYRPARLPLHLSPGVTRPDVLRALEAAGIVVRVDRGRLVALRVPPHIRPPEPAHEH